MIPAAAPVTVSTMARIEDPPKWNPKLSTQHVAGLSHNPAQCEQCHREAGL
jgi:hypothetical protein